MLKFRNAVRKLKHQKEYNNTGEFLLDLRKAKNLTQSDLAKAIDASNQAVSKWENNNGFPDILYQSKLCKVLDISLEELHAGNFNYAQRRKVLFNKLGSYITLIFLIIFIPIFILLAIYYGQNHNSFHVYLIEQTNTDENKDLDIKGMYVTSSKVNTLYISNIKPFMSNWKDTDVVTIDIYNGDDVIFHSTSTENLMIKLDKKDNIDLKDLIVTASVNEKTNLYNSHIDYFDYYNEAVVDNDKYDFKTLKTDDEIIKSLLKDGFKKKTENEYVKIIKGGKVSYYSKERKIYYATLLNSIDSDIFYSAITNTLDVSIYQRLNNISTVLEKYDYDFYNNKLNCVIGECATSKDTIKTLGKYISLLFVE